MSVCASTVQWGCVPSLEVWPGVDGLELKGKKVSMGFCSRYIPLYSGCERLLRSSTIGERGSWSWHWERTLIVAVLWRVTVRSDDQVIEWGRKEGKSRVRELLSCVDRGGRGRESVEVVQRENVSWTGFKTWSQSKLIISHRLYAIYPSLNIILILYIR